MSKKYSYKALHSKVLAVAVWDEEVGDWAAYVGPVQGQKHSEEFMGVARSGCKLPKKVAWELFPHIAQNYKWRD